MTTPSQQISQSQQMRELIAHLDAASRAYYQEDREIMSDYEYDALYDKLVKLEAETGIQLASSPTKKVGYEIVSALEKAPHDIPMLSLDKTKDVSALAGFLGDMEGLLLWKLDGLSIVLRYENGRLHQALTRGNGQIGEDVTHNARVFANIPLTVPYGGSFSVRGEAVITFADFEAINADIAREYAIPERPNDSAKEYTSVLPDDSEGPGMAVGGHPILYKNPRNLCSGTVRQLNSEVASKRRVFFYAFGVVPGDSLPVGENINNSVFADGSADSRNALQRTLKSTQFEWLSAQGFDTVTHKHVTAQTVAQAVEEFKAQIPIQPVATDGLVLTFDDIEYSESLGATSKFPRDSLAFKWADDLSETHLLSVEWNPSRTGLINPVAIFQPVEIEGSVVSRASLHNVSILRGLELGIGDRISVYKANMIIPQVAENFTRSNTVEVPAQCPVCGSDTEITSQRHSPKTGDNDGEPVVIGDAPEPLAQILIDTSQNSDEQLSINMLSNNDEQMSTSVSYDEESQDSGATASDSEVLICTNPGCGAKQMQSLVHFVSRDGLNIEGLSEQTLEKLSARGLISNYADIFKLSRHEEAIISMEGFGRRSYEKLLAAVEKAKDIALPNFIYALGVRHVGLANAKLLCAHYNHDFAQIAAACQSPDYQENLAEIKGFGEAIAHSLHLYFSQETNVDIAEETLSHLRIKAAPATEGSQPLAGLIFVITGDVEKYPNRKALQSHIEGLGGKVTSSVTAKTSYLINNDATSTSSKNKKAAQLGVPVITEEGFEGLLA